MPVSTTARDGSAGISTRGGGLGMTHNNPKTAPLLGLYLGRIAREQVVDAARAIVILQKEHGDRKDRKQARWKYTIRRLGVDVREAGAARALRHRARGRGAACRSPPMQLHLGWHAQRGGRELLRHLRRERPPEGRRSARPCARPSRRSAARVRAHAAAGPAAVRRRRPRRARARSSTRTASRGPSRCRSCARNAMACPAKPTCGLAMTDAENILPALLRRDRGGGPRRRRRGDPHDRLPEQLRAAADRRDRHLRLRQERPRDPGGRLARTARASRTRSTRASPSEQMVPALVGLLRAIRERSAARCRRASSCTAPTPRSCAPGSASTTASSRRVAAQRSRRAAAGVALPLIAPSTPARRRSSPRSC